MKLFFAFLTLFVLISSVSAIVTQTRKSHLSRAQHLHAENLFLKHTLDARATEAAQSLVTNEGDVKYFIFVDAGSGGSRHYLYKSTEKKANEAPTVEKVEACGGNLMPTLAQLDPKSDDDSVNSTVAGFYKNIHVECKALLERKGINVNINDLNVFVQATAGMRVIGESQRHAILEKLNSVTIHGTIKPRAAVISGRWEGFYGFYNAVAKKLVDPLAKNPFTKDNFVYVEIGGASIQVVFTVPDDKYAAVKGVSAPAFVETDEEQGVVQPVFLEVEGPMSLSKLPGLQFSKIFSQSFLGDAGDRMHARAVHKCILDNKGKKTFPCPCLTKGANLIPVSDKSVAKDKTQAGDSPVCFEKSAIVDEPGKGYSFKANKCKDYDIPSGFITLAKDEKVEGTGDFDQCYQIVQSIHSNEKDELKTKVQPTEKPFAPQWAYLKSALDAATAVNKKTHVMINSGGFAFSPAFKATCAKDTEYDYATFKSCLEDSVTTFEPMKKTIPAAEWVDKYSQGYGVPSVHALVKDILTRLGMYKDKTTYKVVFADWTEASSVIAASAQLMPTNDLVSKKAQALYDGADVFGAESENTEVDDSNLAHWYEHVHAKLSAIASWISNSFWSLWNRESSKK